MMEDEQRRHKGEHSDALRASGLKRADVVACRRVIGVSEDTAVRVLLDSGVSGREIADARHGDPYNPHANTESRIEAATQVLRRHFSTQE